MKLISHRGNLDGRNKDYENNPIYIDNAISSGYDVEVDVYFHESNLFLGHDYGEHLIDFNWLSARRDFLWIHCKNIEAIEFMIKTDLHFFWHQNDTLTLTSKLFIWAFPGNQPIEASIAVMPELFNDKIDRCIGICSDFIEKYK